MNPALQGYLAAVGEQLAEAGVLTDAADELEAVAESVESHAGLMRVISDTSVPAAARRGVLADLLAGKVRPEVADLVTRASVVLPAAELTTALHWLATQLRLVAEHGAEQAAHPVAEQVLGLLASRHRVAGYAAAVLAEVSTDELSEIEDELFRFARTVESHRDLRVALGDRDLPVGVRLGVVDDLLGGRSSTATGRLVRYTVRGGRARDIVGTLDMLVEEVARARGWRVARVRSADGIDDARRTALVDALTRLVGAPVELQVTSEPSLLAGVVVEIGDLFIDGSARHRIEELREHVLATQASTFVPHEREED